MMSEAQLWDGCVTLFHNAVDDRLFLVRPGNSSVSCCTRSTFTSWVPRAFISPINKSLSHARVMQDSHCVGMSRKQNSAPAKLRTLAAAGMRCTLMTVPLAEADASSVPSWFHARTTCKLEAWVSVLMRDMHVHADMHQAYTAPGHVKGSCAICTAAKMVVSM